MSRLRDIEQINQLVSQVVISFPSQILIAIISLAFMLIYSFKLLGVAVLMAFIMSLSTIIFLPTLQRKVRDVIVLKPKIKVC